VPNRNDSPDALHLRIAAELRAEVESGALAPGTRLPSEAELTRRFGVSRGTVRQALANLRQQGLVEAVAGRGSFVRRPAPSPPGPAGERSRAVGAVVPSVARPYVPETLQGIEDELDRRGWSMVVASSGSTSERQAGRIRRIVRDGVAGLIVYPIDYDPDPPLFDGLSRRGVPLVFIDRYIPGLGVDAVMPDNVGGAYAAVAHLVGLGHRRIGFVSTDNLTTTSVFERFAGYQQALVAHGLEPDPALILTTLPVTASRPASDPEQARRIVAEIAPYLRRRDRPTAVFALHDVLAMYVAEAAAACGLAVPADLALVGFNDDPMAAAHAPPLTTVAQPREEIGRRAAELLVDRIEGRPAHGGRIVLPSLLVVRRSSGAALSPGEATA
jgi:GntR family transcriptional regulator of arabinose operon